MKFLINDVDCCTLSTQNNTQTEPTAAPRRYDPRCRSASHGIWKCRWLSSLWKRMEPLDSSTFVRGWVFWCDVIFLGARGGHMGERWPEYIRLIKIAQAAVNMLRESSSGIRSRWWRCFHWAKVCCAERHLFRFTSLFIFLFNPRCTLWNLWHGFWGMRQFWGLGFNLGSNVSLLATTFASNS